jgi:hypothetical protein
VEKVQIQRSGKAGSVEGRGLRFEKWKMENGRVAKPGTGHIVLVLVRIRYD